ncbi:uncharacterized protein LOC120420254 [Culex pipiens pallens]|uniref:uncharacterized protein LOC120420254 n=1 Tax=Culex pipiens pallens TaxID=42434 RepID=UPI001954F26B|nr:uncharacterized protein LOC120420254 [Culex pipiens pallens]
MVNMELRIHDLSNNPLAVIPLGEAKIQQGFIRILHPIDISEIKKLINEIRHQLTNGSFCTPMHNLLMIKQQILYDTFAKLTPIINTQTRPHTRQRRWESFGTVLKWIAGTPDAEDLRMINNSMNALIHESNQQILINRQLNERITALANVTNSVLDLYNGTLVNHYQETHQFIMLNNIETLTDHLETIEDAILLAKHGIPSSKILSIHDFNRMATFLGNFDIPIDSMEQILSISTAQVMLNNSHIIYTLKVPQSSKQTYSYNYVDSIITGKKRILISKNYYLRNNSDVYELSAPCTQQRHYYSCPEENISIAPRCIEKLIKGQHSNCSYEKVYSNSIIKRITDDVLLVNNAGIELSSTCSNATQTLNGSYLIQFSNCNLQINGETYGNDQATIKPFIYQPTTGLTVAEYKFIDAPPAEVLRELTLEHREKIETLQLQNNSLHWKTHLFGTFSIGTISLILITYIAVKLLAQRRKRISITLSPDIAMLEHPITSAPPAEQPDTTTQERYPEISQYLSTPTQYRNINFADKVI